MAFSSMDAPVDVMITVQPINLVSCAADLLWSRVLREFPKIKFALSEGGIGWIPYFLERADYVYKHHHHWTHQDFGDKLPSEVFREHVVTCFITDRAGIQGRHAVGVYRVIFVFVAFFGPLLSLRSVVDFADMMLLSMAFPNILGMLLLSGKVRELKNDYVARLRSGEMKPTR